MCGTSESETKVATVVVVVVVVVWSKQARLALHLQIFVLT